ncbi:MAG: hypothetical protein GF334_08420 [Candidatus Altiarchaeales archaeon]|nr:hypothetical protein [Candidatus Altiarchaeales archaeon]
MSKDKRIAHGVRCTWWDSADKVMVVGGIPLCPKCKKACGYVDNEEAWFNDVEQYAATRKNFAEFVEWTRGRCFNNFSEAVRAFTAETGKSVDV